MALRLKQCVLWVFVLSVSSLLYTSSSNKNKDSDHDSSSRLEESLETTVEPTPAEEQDKDEEDQLVVVADGEEEEEEGEGQHYDARNKLRLEFPNIPFDFIKALPYSLMYRKPLVSSLMTVVPIGMPST